MTMQAGDIWFVAPGDILKGRVEPIVWSRMCGAFSRKGWRVRLITPFVKRVATSGSGDEWAQGQWEPPPIPTDHLHAYFDLPQSVTITILPTPLRPESGLWWYRFAISAWFLPYAMWRYLARLMTGRRHVPLIVYGRGYISYLPFMVLGRLLRRALSLHLVFETTAITRSRYDRYLLSRVDLVVVSSQVLKAHVEAMSVSPESILVAPLGPLTMQSGVEVAEPQRFASISSPRAVYTGKGTVEVHRILEDIARALRDDGIQVVVVGSNPRMSTLDNLHFLGFIPPTDVVRYQIHADVLLNVLDPERPIHEHVVPTKLLDYLAASKPIVTMPFLALQELFGGTMPGLIAEDADGIAAAVSSIVLNPEIRAKAEGLAETARQYLPTYDERVAGILEGLESPRGTPL